MPKHSISWAGTSADTLGVIVTASESNNRPKRKIDIEKIPGRNGDVIFVQDAWENVERSYEIVAGGKADGSSAVSFRDIAEWLYTPRGYQKLVDSSESGYFFLAYYAGGFDVENMLTRYGRAEITFNCRPERFKDSGDITETISGSSGSRTYANDTGFPAKPVFIVKGSGEFTLTVSNTAKDAQTVLTITNLASTTYIDCETMNVYSGTGVNLNYRVVIVGRIGDKASKEFPVLYPGSNSISWAGAGVTSVGIKPRWWTI